MQKTVKIKKSQQYGSCWNTTIDYHGCKLLCQEALSDYWHIPWNKITTLWIEVNTEKTKCGRKFEFISTMLGESVTIAKDGHFYGLHNYARIILVKFLDLCEYYRAQRHVWVTIYYD